MRAPQQRRSRRATEGRSPGPQADYYDLTTAAVAALRRCRYLTQVLRWIAIELLFALGAAEVIRLPFVVGSSSGGSRFYVHSAHKISYSSWVLHYIVSFVPVFPVQPGGQSQERLLGRPGDARSDCQCECPIPAHRLPLHWQIPHVLFSLASRSKVTIPYDHTADEVFFLT